MKHSLPALLVLVLVAGCGGGSSDVVDEAEGDPNAPAGADAPPASTAVLPPGQDSPAPNGGTTPPSGTTPTGTPSAGPFAGAAPYAAILGPSTIDTSGKGNGHLSFNAQGNPAGRACLACHDGAGKGGAPAFLFAGTLYSDKAATKPAASAEVRMVGADGKGLSAFTDANGNFFFRASAGAVAIPAVAGARNATITRSMTNKISDGNCNGCHDPSMRLTF